MPPDESWTRYAAADFDRLRQPGTRDRPGSVRVGQAERYVDGLASPGGDLQPKWRDYFRRFRSLLRSIRGPAGVEPAGGTAAENAGPAPGPPSWTERAREFAPRLLPLARQLDELNAALTPGRESDAFRRLFHGGRLELTRLFHEEATRALQKAVDHGEQQVAQHAFHQRVAPAADPAQPAQPTLPSLIAQAANGDVERRRAVQQSGRRPVPAPARPGLTRSASAPTPRGPARK